MYSILSITSVKLPYVFLPDPRATKVKISSMSPGLEIGNYRIL